MARYSVSNDNFIIYILQRLPIKYELVVANINSNIEPTEIEDVQVMLLSQKNLA